MQHFKDKDGLMRDNYDYHLVMKRLVKLSYMENRPKLVLKRGELNKIIFGESGAKHTGVVKDDDKMLSKSAKYLVEQVLILNDSNHKLPGEV